MELAEVLARVALTRISG